MKKRNAFIQYQLLGLFGALWLVGIAIGFGYLANYENQPGPLADAPTTWPHDSELTFPTRGHQLLIFLHPHCPCTRATIAELSKVAASITSKQVHMVALFTQPTGVDENWVHGTIWQQAKRIPNLELRTDSDGCEAKRFGIHTSGHVLCYGSNRSLRFTGGITASRGHEGDNRAEADLVSIVSGRSSSDTIVRHKCFGCPLFNSPARQTATSEPLTANE